MDTPSPPDAPDIAALQRLCEEFPGPYALSSNRTARRSYYHVSSPNRGFVCPVANYAFDDVQVLLDKANALPSVLTALAAATATIARLEAENAELREQVEKDRGFLARLVGNE